MAALVAQLVAVAHLVAAHEGALVALALAVLRTSRSPGAVRSAGVGIGAGTGWRLVAVAHEGAVVALAVIGAGWWRR